MTQQSRISPLVEQFTDVVREELQSVVWAIPTTDVEPMLADLAAERTLLSTIRAGFGESSDLLNLGAEHFVDRRCGMVFELVASGFRGQTDFDDDVIARVISRQSGVDEATIGAWLVETDTEWPVCLSPSVREQARRLLDIAAFRRFFEHVAILETDSRLAAARGLDLDAPRRLRRILDNLNEDLGRKPSLWRLSCRRCRTCVAKKVATLPIDDSALKSRFRRAVTASQRFREMHNRVRCTHEPGRQATSSNTTRQTAQGRR